MRRLFCFLLALVFATITACSPPVEEGSMEPGYMPGSTRTPSPVTESSGPSQQAPADSAGAPGHLTPEAFADVVLAAAQAMDASFQVEERQGMLVKVKGDGTPQRPGKTVDLGLGYEEYVRQPEMLEHIIEGFARALVAVPPHLADTFAEVRERVFPRVVSDADVQRAARMGADWTWVPFMEGLAITFVVDFPERYVFINTTQAAAWRVSPETLHKVSLENLDRQTKAFEPVQLREGAYTIYIHATGDGYDSSRILLIPRMQALQDQVEGRLVIIIPSRDAFVAFGDSDPVLVQKMAEYAVMDFQNTQFSITPALLTLENGRIVPYREGGVRP